ncbi:unnamed protein product [Ectocarpus sp. 6 AP-2014]
MSTFYVVPGGPRASDIKWRVSFSTSQYTAPLLTVGPPRAYQHRSVPHWTEPCGHRKSANIQTIAASVKLSTDVTAVHNHTVRNRSPAWHSFTFSRSARGGHVHTQECASHSTAHMDSQNRKPPPDAGPAAAALPTTVCIPCSKTRGAGGMGDDYIPSLRPSIHTNS